jgi:hypothetical protein
LDKAFWDLVAGIDSVRKDTGEQRSPGSAGRSSGIVPRSLGHGRVTSVESHLNLPAIDAH